MTKHIGLIRTFVQHPNAANLLMALILLVGMFSATQINRQVFPPIGLDAVSARFIWPGAGAEDIDTSILEVVEPEIRFVDGVKEVNGDASEGSGGFWIVFAEGTNMSRAFSDIENGIRRVEDQLPEDMERPIITQFELMEPVSRIALSGPFSEGALKAIAKSMRDDLLDRGIGKVNFIGARDPEIRVNVDPAVLRRLDIKIGDIARHIRDSNVDIPSGTAEGSFERQIRSLGQAKTLETLSETKIHVRSTGEMLELGDIADLEDGFDEAQPEGFFHGEQAITLQIMRSRDMDSIDASEIVEAYLTEIRGTMAPSLSVFHYDIRSNLVKDRIWLMVKNGGSGLVLVLIILYIFLNGRVAFWVAMGIPVAMLATFGFMAATGQTFNMLSLMALIMTLGIIVDDAIVVGEHAATRKEMGLPAAEAAESGASRMFAPVVASSLTTIMAFFPVLLLTDRMGQILVTLPIIVIAVIFASLVECFLILPGHLKSALAHTKVKTTGFRVTFNRKFMEFRDTTFKRWLETCYKARYTTIAIGIAVLIVGRGLLVSGHVPFVNFPTAESEYLIANIEMNPGAPRELTAAALTELDRALYAAEEELTNGKGGLVTATFGTVGRSMNQQSWRELSADNLAGLRVELVTADERDIRNPQMLAAWRAQIKPLAGVDRLVIAEQVFGLGGRPVDIRLFGADIQTLKAAATEVRILLARFPGLLEIDDDLPYGKEEIILELTPKGRALGFTTRSVSRQVRNASEGIIAKRFPRDSEETKVRIQFPEGTFNAQVLRELYLRSESGVEVPLAEVVSIRTGQGFAQIRRFNGKNEVAVVADVNRKLTNITQLVTILPEQGLDAIAQKYGIEYTFRGEAEDQGRSLDELFNGALLALASIYIILAWVLGSYSQPLIVMAIIPFGLIGAVLGHLLLGYDMSMMSMVGLLGLMGILVNDSIILMTTIQERFKLGETWEKAVIAGTQDRLRAVILTSLTTIGGLTPMLFETSMQAQVLKPMAITMVFGIGMATFVVVFLVPALLGFLDDVPAIKTWLKEFLLRLYGRLRKWLSAPKSRA